MWEIYEQYIEKFGDVLDEYLPDCGEGDNLATQTVVATHKLMRNWFYNGDAFDHSNRRIGGWNLNDISSYANWLAANAGGTAKHILAGIVSCEDGREYARLIYKLANVLLNEKKLKEKAKYHKRGTVYKCNGPYAA